MPLILDTVNKSLVIELLNTVTNQPDFTVNYADRTLTSFNEGSADGTLADLSETTILIAPAVDTKRIIKTITVYNADTTNITILLKLVNNTDKRIIEKVTLLAYETWKFTGDPYITNTAGPLGDAMAFSWFN